MDNDTPGGAFPAPPDLESILGALPGLYLVLRADAPRFTIVAASDAYLRATLTSRHGPRGIIGRGIFEVFPDPPGRPEATGEANLRASLLRAVATGEPDAMAVQHYPIAHPDGRWEERHWSPLNTPVRDPRSGRVTHLIHRVEDVTERMMMESALDRLSADRAESERGRLEALDVNEALTQERAAAARAHELLQDQAAELEIQAAELQATAAHLQERTAEAEAARERYHALFSSIDSGFCVIQVLVDDAGRPVDYLFLETNPAFVEQTGLAGAVGRTAREAVPGLEPHWFETYGRVAATGEAIRFENGSEPMGRWFDVFAFRIGAPEERQVALLFRDITAERRSSAERERLLADLELERNRLAEVFRQAPTFLAVLRGPDHVFELVNEAYYRLVGRRELIGMPVFEALPEVRGQGFKELLDHVLATGEPFVGREIPLLVARTAGADPEERFVDLTFLAMVESDGTRNGVIAHGADMTEQVLARREAERARDEAEAARTDAEAANRAKSEFLAVMSHELRTPLNAIGGYAELIEMGIRGPVTAAQVDDLRRIQRSQRHLLGLINEVLNYAKLETGTVEFHVADVPVREAFSTAELLVAPQARSKGLTLAFHEVPSTLTVRADPEKLHQVLVNLASNAVKFTEAGGHVEISWEAAGDRVLIHVRDTGIGIPGDRLHAIFDPFVQVRSDLSRPHEGTGLGLAISRDLARAMGGEIAVESRVDGGSTFTLTLPAS